MPDEIRFSPLVDHLRHLYPHWDGVKQLNGTEKRLYQMFEELCWSEEKIQEELERHTKLFEDGYQESLTASGIVVTTLCPHHLLPCRFRVSVTYEPQGKVLGLSKFARIAVILGKRPIMQETYTRELAECLMIRTNPKMVEVETKGVHGCLLYRGAKQEEMEVVSKVRLPR